jgi:hypothetical protein
MADEPGGLGAHNVKVNITGDAEGVKKAAKQADEHIAGLRIRLGQSGMLVANIFKNIQLSLADIPKVAGVGVLIHQLREIQSVGAQFTNQMEQTLLGLKAIYAQQINVYDAQWNQVELGEKMLVSQKAIGEQIEKIKTDALVTVATLSQITGIFQMALPVALSLGMSLDQTRGFVVSMVKTAGAMGVPMEHLNMEVRDALQGYVQMEDKMLRSLGLTTEKLQQWKAVGPDALIANLLKKMEAFDAASKEAGDTWQGVTSSLQDFKEQLSGMVMAPAIDVLRKALIAIRDSLGEVQNGVFIFNDRVLAVVGGLRTGFEQVVKVLVALGETFVQLASVAASLDAATGGTLKWVAAGYVLFSVLQSVLSVVKAISAAKWFQTGIAALGFGAGMNPVTMWISVALLGLTAVMTLWNRMKGSIQEDLDGFDKRVKEMQANVDKSKQREARLTEAGEKVKGMEAPGRLAGARGEGVRRINDVEVEEAVKAETEDEVKWVEDMKTLLNPMQARYKAVQELFDKKEFTKASVLRAINESRAEEQEEQKKLIASARVELMDKEQTAKANLKNAEAQLAQAEADLKAENTYWDEYGVVTDTQFKKDARARAVQARADRQKAMEELEKIPRESARLDAQANIRAVPNETPQEKSIREKKEQISIEVNVKRTLLGIEEKLLETDRGRKIAATGYYLTVHSLQQQELKNTEAALAQKVKEGELTEDQAAKYLKHAKEKQALDLKANVQSMIEGKVALKDIPVVVRRQSFAERQESEAEGVRAQGRKEILDASAKLTEARAEVERLKAIADPMKRLELPKKEQELEAAEAKYERAYSEGEIKLIETRRKQRDEAKAEEERDLKHRIAMGQATEQDEIARLYRLSKSEEETRADRDKAEEEHREKAKAEEERLLQHRIAIGQATEADELERLYRIATNEKESLANRQKATEQYREKFKAEEERLLQHRNAMGQSVEQDELDRLYRIARDPNESLANRMKAEEQHFAKFKSLEQSLFDYRKSMGLISMELEIARLRAIAGAANRTAEERMAAEQKVYDLEKALIDKRRSGAKNLVEMGKQYLKEKYGEQEANRGRSEADWGRVADEAIAEKQRKLDTLKNSAVKTPEQMQQMYDLDKELSDLRSARREIGGTKEQIQGGTVPTPATDNFRRIAHERDILYNKKDRTPEEEEKLKTLQAAMPGAYREAEAEKKGETQTQREAAAGTSPASPAFTGVAKVLGLDTLPGNASKAFEQVATSYQELLNKMTGAAAVAGTKIQTLLYEGFVGRLKQDLQDEVNRS